MKFILLVALLVAPAPAVAQANLGTYADRIAVEDVMARYVWTVDSLDADGYAAVFTEDAVIDANGNISRGRAEIRKIVTDLIRRRDDNSAKGLPPSNLYHVISSPRITFPKAGEALHQSYWQTMRRDADGRMITAAMGRSEDHLVKRNGAWLIQFRKLTVFDDPGTPARISAAEQKKPDFSGGWAMNRQASRLSQAASGIQSGTVEIDHREPAFRYKASLLAGTTPIEYEFQVMTDGTELTGTQQGRPVVTRLAWEKDALVLTSRIGSAESAIRISFRYELLDNGRRLRATEQLRGGGRDQDNVWIFDRRATTTVTRLYTGADGLSHAEDIQVAWRTAKLRPELSESEAAKVAGAQFLRWPRGFVWEGHPASKRQYVVIVSGRGEVDVAGGKVPLAPGRVLLAEDTTGKGHITRVGPDEDLVMLLVPLARQP